MLATLLLPAAAAGCFTTLAAECRHEEVIKKSRFVAVAAPVKDADDALSFVRAAADQKARHNCFAWRLSDESMRTNGDGEPGGTAGPPILAAIDGAGLKDVAVVVTRYRLDGGAKLGTGGLVRAYGGAAEACLAGAPVTTREARSLMSVRYGAADTGAVFAVLAEYSPSVVEEGSTADGSSGEEVMLETSFEAPPEEATRLAAQLTAATNGRIDGIWAESPDDEFPFPAFVAGTST